MVLDKVKNVFLTRNIAITSKFNSNKYETLTSLIVNQIQLNLNKDKWSVQIDNVEVTIIPFWNNNNIYSFCLEILSQMYIKQIF